MRDRAKALREAREQERAAIVEGKKYQQWMRNCEELRTMRSKLEHEVFLLPLWSACVSRG
jgi:hypothetical protein